MKSERWQQVEHLYHAALAQNVDERPDFLAVMCAGDEELRREVESLLAFEVQSADFIETPALDVAAKIMAQDQVAHMTAGQTINHYIIISALGAGGMGEVYLAEDTRLHRRVAIKFLPSHLTQDKRYLGRFEQEARTVAALSHPHVCTIHEVIATGDGRHCIVMEYVEGMTLREVISKRKLTVPEAVDIASQIASALSAAHSLGIVHRDIKPENIMLRKDGYLKILDFGLAKLIETETSTIDHEAATKLQLSTSPGIVMGTVHYMSPEQARGLPVDARTDIWSLGVVLYESMAGVRPFNGETTTDVIISVAQRDPPPLSNYLPDVPVELEQIVKRCLEKEREQRYQSAETLLNDLKRLKRELELDPERARSTNPTITQRTSATSITSRKLAIAAVIALLVIIASILAFKSFRSGSAPPPQTEVKSLAVLPLTNLSGDPAQDYFAEGMTETLIAGLAQVRALRVMPRISVMQYKNAQKPVAEIARELNVNAIVDGSVQHLGDRVQINIELVETANNRQLWSRSYNRDIKELLNVQSEVAQAVTQAIAVKLTRQEQQRLAGVHEIDPVAYDYFLRGKFYLNRQTKDDNQEAITMFEKAVATDQNFAAAQAELAQAYVWRSFLFTPDEQQLQEKAFVAVEKALSLDPDLAEAHLARGRLLWTPYHHFPHDQAIQEYRRAIDLNPSLDEAHHQLALVYGHVGLLDEAMPELDKAIALNPGNSLARYRVGETMLFQCKYEQALTVLRTVPREVNPALVGHQIAWALFGLGRKDEAAATLDQFLKDYPEDNRGLLTSLQAMLAASDKQERKAEEKIKLALQKAKGFGHFHHTAYFVGSAYALMNKPDEAIKWLEQAADEGFPCYPLFEKDSNLDNLRQDPRFIALLAKLKQQMEGYKKLVSSADSSQP